MSQAKRAIDAGLFGGKSGGPAVAIGADVAYNAGSFKALFKLDWRKQERIIRASIRKSLSPLVAEMRSGAVPVSSGQRHLSIIQRKVERGWKHRPAHSRESARLVIKKSKYIRGAVFASLELESGLRWYQQILASGFQIPGGGRVAPRSALGTIATKARSRARIMVPSLISINGGRALQREINKKRRSGRMKRAR